MVKQRLTLVLPKFSTLFLVQLSTASKLARALQNTTIPHVFLEKVAKPNLQKALFHQSIRSHFMKPDFLDKGL